MGIDRSLLKEKQSEANPYKKQYKKMKKNKSLHSLQSKLRKQQKHNLMFEISKISTYQSFRGRNMERVENTKKKMIFSNISQNGQRKNRKSSCGTGFAFSINQKASESEVSTEIRNIIEKIVFNTLLPFSFLQVKTENEKEKVRKGITIIMDQVEKEKQLPPCLEPPVERNARFHGINQEITEKLLSYILRLDCLKQIKMV
ncbi:13840_t:CDS:2 [Acaulospora morrowiae]|uniref:13840_t:CDS:1 n=1 Tax=Acaulospora morrowiae TaxID=94023 RepID=A0A9N9BNA4_9GLOM|nr:13840_t:CDS:2 [Acaulospora morrowiae]